MPSPGSPASPSRCDELRLVGHGAASDYAVALLASLGWPVAAEASGPPDPSPARAWAESGAMSLSGDAAAPPQAAPAPVASCADGAARALAALARATTSATALRNVDGAALLGERAALQVPAPTRAGRQSAGRSCRLVACDDGWLALNLARSEDRDLLPAWLEAPLDGSDPSSSPVPWDRVERVCAERPRDPLVARGREMGLAVSPAWERDAATGTWQHGSQLAPARPVCTRAPLVIDLSSLWAGPLCGQLLAACGARVVKVESLERPDGARAGSPPFFDVLNGPKESVALPFREDRGRRALAELISRADIVIESSRPRALAQLGIDAEATVARRGTTWISITGHGRQRPRGDWVAFGDDAAAAGGLLCTGPGGEPWFCGDAIADPLTGVHAALAGLSAWAGGGGRLVALGLSQVAAWVRACPAPEPGRADREAAARPPRARPPVRRAPGLGADTRRVLAELCPGC